MSKLMTQKEYRSEIDALASTCKIGVADAAYLERIDTLHNNWKEAIINNTDEAEFTGTAYYVSNSGNDENDGLSPETAWATLKKASSALLEFGDAVLFERGGIWRGQLAAANGVTYSAYGNGEKPKIYGSYSCTEKELWVKTDIPDVWKYDCPFNEKDIGVVVFDGALYAEKKYTIADLKNDLDFVFTSVTSFEKNIDNKIYLKCEKGNPAELFKNIEASRWISIIKFRGGYEFKNITFLNLDLSYGTDYFFPSAILENVILKYCTLQWMGGHAMSNREGVSRKRFCSGGGCWLGCKNLRFENCYFLQHFDAGTSPQYSDHNNNLKVIFDTYVVSDCLFDKCEYPFEYFIHCSRGKESLKSKYIDVYVGYNFITGTGKGFGDKPDWSCIKGWSGHNFSENCVIEKNIHDRPAVCAVSISAKDIDNNYLKEELFKLNQNVYVVDPDLRFVTANKVDYFANEKGFNELIADEIETNPVLMITEK